MLTTYHEDGVLALEMTSGGSDDGTSDPERSDNGDDDDEDGEGSLNGNEDEDSTSSLGDPMNGWEEFDVDADYQKKHVDPEMREWVLTNDCRRIISDKFFNNPVHDQGMHKPFPKSGAECVAYSLSVSPVL